MPPIPTRTRAAISERRTQAATVRSVKRGIFLGAMNFPSRETKDTFPSRSSSRTGGSGSDIASPRVTILDSAGVSILRVTRWTTRRQARPNSTMSPSETARLSTRSIRRVSPGQIAGSMLVPLTCRRSAPDERKTSAASSHLTACESSGIASKKVMTWSKTTNSQAGRTSPIDGGWDRGNSTPSHALSAISVFRIPTSGGASGA